MKTRTLVLVLAAAALAACSSAGGGATADSIRAKAPAGSVTVMTRNLFVGADLFAPFVAEDPLLAASTVFGQILASDVPGRMAEIAAEIAGTHPELVGLQEGFRFVVTPLGDPGTVLLDLDFLALLEAALAAQPGLSYQRVVEQEHTPRTIPLVDQGIAVTVIDRDAILADADVDVLSVGGGDFEAEFVTTLADVIPVRVTRGWTEAEVRHAGVAFTFVNTHLEVKDLGPLQSLQALELIARFGMVSPLVVVGDFNSDPRDPPAPFAPAPGGFLPTPYTTLASALIDAWPGVGGLTCCFDADLAPPSRPLFERVDLIFASPGFSPTFTYRTGFQQLPALASDGSPRWPSDHTGVVGFLGLPPSEDLEAVAAR